MGVLYACVGFRFGWRSLVQVQVKAKKASKKSKASKKISFRNQQGGAEEEPEKATKTKSSKVIL